MFSGAIAKPPEKRNRPSNADEAENSEAPPPAHEREDKHDEPRRERSTPPRRQPEQALRAGPFAVRQPDREYLRQIRKTTRLTDAEENAKDEQRNEIPGDAC